MLEIGQDRAKAGIGGQVLSLVIAFFVFVATPVLASSLVFRFKVLEGGSFFSGGGVSGPVAQAVEVTANVDLLREGETTPVPLTTGTQLENGDRLTSDGTGMAVVSFDDGSMLSLPSDSSVVIESFSHGDGADESVWELINGALVFVSGALAGGGGSMEVDTEFGVIGIRGTAGLIVVGADHTRVTLLPHRGPDAGDPLEIGNVRLIPKDTAGTRHESHAFDLDAVGMAEFEMRAEAGPRSPVRVGYKTADDFEEHQRLAIDRTIAQGVVAGDAGRGLIDLDTDPCKATNVGPGTRCSEDSFAGIPVAFDYMIDNDSYTLLVPSFNEDSTDLNDLKQWKLKEDNFLGSFLSIDGKSISNVMMGINNWHAIGSRETPAHYCHDLFEEGKDDWCLPSKEEAKNFLPHIELIMGEIYQLAAFQYIWLAEVSTSGGQLGPISVGRANIRIGGSVEGLFDKVVVSSPNDENIPYFSDTGTICMRQERNPSGVPMPQGEGGPE